MRKVCIETTEVADIVGRENGIQKPLVLIVDDEANARTALAELFRDEGYEVATAADGFKALGKFHHLGPDVVLTDLKMPGMSGLELLAKKVQVLRVLADLRW